MDDNFKLKQSLWGEDVIRKCSHSMCNRMLVKGKVFFWDMITGDDLCESCGKCLRYSRKKAHERGESIESAEIM